MTLYRLFIVMVFLLASEMLAGQTVEWSNQQKIKSKSNYTLVLGENAAGVFLMRAKNNEFSKELIIEKYKSNLAQESSKEFWQPSGSFVEKTLLQDIGILVFGSTKNSGTGKVDLFYWKMDDNLNTDMVITPLLQVESSEFKDNNSFYVKQSTDKSKFAVMYITAAADKNSSVLHVQGFNEKLSGTFKKQYNLPHTVEDIVITSFECDNDGNAFILLDFPKPSDKKKVKGQRSFFLYAFYTQDQALLEYDLGNDSSYINEIGMVVNNYDKSVGIAGFYTHSSGDPKVGGSFYYVVDIASTQIRTKIFTEFDKTFVNRVAGSMMNEASPGLTDLYIRRIVPRSDGGCLIVAEKYYESRQTYTYYVNGFPQTASRAVYNYDEIILISLTGNGEVQFKEFIKKSQSSVNDGGYYSSFITVNTNDRVAFIYSSDASTEGDVMVSTITPNGMLDTKILIKAMSYYVALMPPESKQVSANSSLVCALKDRRFCVMRLTF